MPRQRTCVASLGRGDRYNLGLFGCKISNPLLFTTSSTTFRTLDLRSTFFVGIASV